MTYTVQSLLKDYQKQGGVKQAKKLTFAGVGDRDVYNITAPFIDEGERVIAGRVEGRDTEYSDVFFFVEQEGHWVPRENTPTFSLQDPFVTTIGGQLVFGGVQVTPDPNDESKLTWKTVFYKGNSIRQLEPLTEGPEGMKDIRLLELQDGRIAVFTRPQGEKGGRGKIGFTKVNSLSQLTVETIDQAPLIEPHFTGEEWGGANELYLLENGDIGVLGHIAEFDEEGDRHYYPITSRYKIDSNQLTDMKIIATRRDFPEGSAKRPDLADVLFSGGLLFLENGEAELYVGVSDAEAHKAVVPNPFI
ncbi:DUF1861 family protein [Halobacillus sp. Marseille-Q1614]|uniref:MTP-1 family protein n=1 Tax=Halobacillus sp. Marseille-Q1614 TaxID=2709134 RepID=UPI00156F0CE4|nr:DUF1861 family protein [Halobacillus sp. Marseille-Q1614]